MGWRLIGHAGKSAGLCFLENLAISSKAFLTRALPTPLSAKYFINTANLSSFIPLFRKSPPGSPTRNVFLSSERENDGNSISYSSISASSGHFLFFDKNQRPYLVGFVKIMLGLDPVDKIFNSLPFPSIGLFVCLDDVFDNLMTNNIFFIEFHKLYPFHILEHVGSFLQTRNLIGRRST